MPGSHVFISKVILKNFSFRNYKKNKTKQRLVYCAELPFGHARCHDIEDFNTKPGAYSSKSEKILKNEFEDSVGLLSTMFRKGIDLNKREIDKLVIKRMFAYQCIRDNTYINIYVNKIAGVKKISPEEADKLKDRFIQEESARNKDLLENSTLNKNKLGKSISSIFDGYKLVLLLDGNNGLIGSNYIIRLPFNIYGYNAFGFSLSPNCMLILTNDITSDIASNYVIARRFLKPAEVNSINKEIIRIGKSKKYGIVISDNKELLNSFL